MSASDRRSAADHDSDQQPAANHSSDQQPAANHSSDQQPAADHSSDQRPVTDHSSDQRPAADGDWNQRPGADHASDRQPDADHASRRRLPEARASPRQAGDPDVAGGAVDHEVPPRDRGQVTRGHAASAGRRPNRPPDSPGREAPRLPAESSSKEWAAMLGLCRHVTNCYKDTCGYLHLCRFFIAGICVYGKRCAFPHVVKGSQRNLDLLDRLELLTLSEEDLLQGLKDGYLVRNPITREERLSRIQICRFYDRENGCALARGHNCFRLHACKKHVFGSCEDGVRCSLSHDLKSPHNVAVLEYLGLHDLDADYVLHILRLRSGVPSTSTAGWLPVGAPAGTSHTSSWTGAPAEPAAPAAGADGHVADRPLGLCAVHASGLKCRRIRCDALHVCGYFLAGLCERLPNSCPLGHSLVTAHNVRAMKLHGLTDWSAEQLRAQMDDVTRLARVTFANGAQQKVLMCMRYDSADGCGGGDGCDRFHVCGRFLAGVCDVLNCGRDHNLTGQHNRRVREALGLSDDPARAPDAVWATDADLLELLRARLGLPPCLRGQAAAAPRVGREVGLEYRIGILSNALDAVAPFVDEDVRTALRNLVCFFRDRSS